MPTVTLAAPERRSPQLTIHRAYLAFKYTIYNNRMQRLSPKAFEARDMLLGLGHPNSEPRGQVICCKLCRV
jgi:hypothetical protein